MIAKVVRMMGGAVVVYCNGSYFDCEIKGSVKKREKVLVGDNVKVIKDEFSPNKYIITDVYPRTNSLMRPPLANLDTLFIVLAPSPKPDFMLIDKMIIYCNINNLKPVIVINKMDLADKDFVVAIKSQYANVVPAIICVSGKTGEGVDKIVSMLSNKTSAFTGQSAVGKSTLINSICPNLKISTNTLSKKIERGQHTTRHNEIYPLKNNVFLADTPGFSMLSLKNVNYYNLHKFYTEFAPYANACTFSGCTHINCPEDVCGVIKAVNSGELNGNRYNRYYKLYNEIKQNEEWKYD